MLSTTINSTGLVLDIMAGLILFRYGLPANIDPEGRGRLLLEQIDEKEKKLAQTYKTVSKFGITLLVIGFFLQLISNYIPN